MTDNKEAIISKIRKVLALATNNSSKEEGENAILIAQKMMIENNIVSSDIKEIQPTKEVTDEIGYSAKKSKWWHNNLASIIASNFKCFVYIEHLRYLVSITNIKFLGLKEDVELAKAVYLYAITFIDYSSKKYAQEHKENGSTSEIKNQYILGFLAGLRVKFADQIQKNNWGLIIVKDALVITAQKKLHLRSFTSSNARMGFDSNARDAGYTQGKQFTPIMGNLTGGK